MNNTAKRVKNGVRLEFAGGTIVTLTCEDAIKLAEAIAWEASQGEPLSFKVGDRVKFSGKELAAGSHQRPGTVLALVTDRKRFTVRWDAEGSFAPYGGHYEAWQLQAVQS